MNDTQLKEIIYNLMTDNHNLEVQPFSGSHLIVNEFAEGRECGELYEEVYEANRRLCARLGVEEDSDVELIVNNLLRIAEILSNKMYDYGAIVLPKEECVE